MEICRPTRACLLPKRLRRARRPRPPTPPRASLTARPRLSRGRAAARSARRHRSRPAPPRRRFRSHRPLRCRHQGSPTPLPIPTATPSTRRREWDPAAGRSYAQTTYSLYDYDSVKFTDSHQNTYVVSCTTNAPSPSLPSATISAGANTGSLPSSIANFVTQLTYDGAEDLTVSATPDGNGSVSPYHLPSMMNFAPSRASRPVS